METPNNKGKQPQRIAERLVLLREYLIANASRKRAVRIQDMKQYLNDKDDNCGIKPIYRALAILTTDFNMDLEYSEKSKGWILKNPPFTQHELRLIVDSIQASKFITQEKAKQLTAKVRKQAGAEGKETLNRQAYVYERIKSMNDSVVNEEDRIYQAILTGQQISFKYYHRTHDRRKPREYTSCSRNNSRIVRQSNRSIKESRHFSVPAFDLFLRKPRRINVPVPPVSVRRPL